MFNFQHYRKFLFRAGEKKKILFSLNPAFAMEMLVVM